LHTLVHEHIKIPVNCVASTALAMRALRRAVKKMLEVEGDTCRSAP